MRGSAFLMTVLALACAGQAAAQERVIPEALQGIYDTYHYAPAVRVGNTLYVSGVVAGDPDPEAQFDRAFRNLQFVLAEAGATLSDVVDLTTFHIDMSEHIEAFQKVKDRYMEDNYPAWTAIGIDQLFSPRALVEIKVVAVVDNP